MPRNESGQLEPGSVLAGRYRIERFLAGGGMGLVYIAQDQRLAERRCAIKEIFDRFTNPEERVRAIEYFHREADTLSQLKHPAVPAIVDRFGEGNCHYLVMDFIEGTNLEEELAAQGGSLPESRVVEIARELCDVLAYLHSFQPPIIYRDMKPSNVILTPDGRVVLIDFGIARIFTPQGKATLIGTPGFAPPEQYTGKVDERSDLYGLAATLHYLLTGRDPEKHPPFSFPPVHTLKPEASPFLAQAIDKALAYKVEERPVSVSAFKEMVLYGQGLDVQHYPATAAKSATQPLELIIPPDSMPEVPQPRQRRRWRRTIAALVFWGVLIGGGYQLATHPELLDTKVLARVGEQIPWGKVEAWLPESGKIRLREFVANLPWEREKRLQALRADPVELVSLKLVNTSRDGTPLPGQKTPYTDGEVQYLTWEATLKNRLAGMEGTSYRLEGRFFDPEGGLAGKSEAGRYVRPEEQELTLRGITLLDGLKERAKGNYQFELYIGDKKLETQMVRIEAEPKKLVKAENPTPNRPSGAVPAPDELRPGEAGAASIAAPPSGPTPYELARLEEQKRRIEEEKRQARILEGRKKPLDLVTVRFLNTDKNGSRLQKESESFGASQVRFVAWEAEFRNRLYNLEPSYHRLEGSFRAPNGQLLGTVEDQKEVGQQLKSVTFTARLGNSSGGAFAPGTYRVEFYLDGWPLVSKEFTVVDDRDRGSVAVDGHDRNLGAVDNRDRSLASLLRSHTGSMHGLVSNREVDLDLEFRPQADGSLRGSVTIHEPGYGTGPLEGRTEGNQVEFRSSVGRATYVFHGWREGDRLSGTYRVAPSGGNGHWSVRLGGS